MTDWGTGFSDNLNRRAFKWHTATLRCQQLGKSWAKAGQKLGLTIDESQILFNWVLPVQPSELLLLTLREYLPLATAVNTEKARSELLIAPVLYSAPTLSACVGSGLVAKSH
jgi:hypothetical protein